MADLARFLVCKDRSLGHSYRSAKHKIDRARVVSLDTKVFQFWDIFFVLPIGFVHIETRKRKRDTREVERRSWKMQKDLSFNCIIFVIGIVTVPCTKNVMPAIGLWFLTFIK